LRDVLRARVVGEFDGKVNLELPGVVDPKLSPDQHGR